MMLHKIIIILTVLLNSLFNHLKAQDSLVFKNYITSSVGVSLFKNKANDSFVYDKEIELGLDFAIMYSRKMYGNLFVTIGAIASNRNSVFLLNDSAKTKTRIEESFVTFPVALTVIRPLECFKCNRDIRLITSYGAYYSVSATQKISAETNYKNSKTKIEDGYGKFGGYFDVSLAFISKNRNINKYATNYVFGLRVMGDGNNVFNESSKSKDRAIFPTYTSITFYLNIINFFK